LSITEYPSELANVVQNLADEPAVIFSSDLGRATKWALQVIPSIHYPNSYSKDKNFKYFLKQIDDEVPTLNSQSFTDYLFCIYSFLSNVSPSDIGWMDKRWEQIASIIPSLILPQRIPGKAL
jgi:hypothetical protein